MTLSIHSDFLQTDKANFTRLRRDDIKLDRLPSGDIELTVTRHPTDEKPFVMTTTRIQQSDLPKLVAFLSKK